MRIKILLGAMLAGLLALGYAFTLEQPVAAAGGPKNLKVFPKGTSKKEVKKVMKGWSKALGEKCDYCHEMDDFSKDTKNKRKAREMFRMVRDINKSHLGKYKGKVSCATCHRGEKKPTK
jgi:hypothetical protein